MGSREAVQAKTDKLEQWAERIGEILAQRTFGEQGPDLQTSLADLEELLGPVLQRVTAGYLRTAVSEQAERLPGQVPCPTCGRECIPTAPDQLRRMTTEHGDFCFAERTCFCDRCQRSFFPAALDSED